jgi:predicted DNA repair protein MutK
MLWVGGGILVHGAHQLGFAWPDETIHHASVAAASTLALAGPVVSWLVTAIGSAIVGVAIGAALAVVVHQVGKLRHKPAGAAH